MNTIVSIIQVIGIVPMAAAIWWLSSLASKLDAALTRVMSLEDRYDKLDILATEVALLKQRISWLETTLMEERRARDT
jgi:hypothetical protein